MELINIRNNDIIGELDKIIEELKIHDVDGMCVVYTSLIMNRLASKNILCKMINTNDLDITYEHYFLLIPYMDSYILVDPTYEQFEEKGELYAMNWYPANLLKSEIGELYNDFINKKYMIVNDELISKYLYSLSGVKKEYSLDSIYIDFLKL